MTELSPAALAVLNAVIYQWDADRCPISSSLAAAALRAAAVEVVLPKYQYADWGMADLIMQELQTIADELENAQ